MLQGVFLVARRVAVERTKLLLTSYTARSSLFLSAVQSVNVCIIIIIIIIIVVVESIAS
jgi:hypothetical protein